MVNLGDRLNVVSLLAVASVTADGNGSGVDLLEYEGEMAFVLSCSAGTGDHTMDVKLQDSADNSTFSDISGGAFTQVTTVAGVQKISLNKNELKRYVRAVKDIGGTSSPTFILGVNALGVKKYQA
jgi:hypothetical protein